VTNFENEEKYIPQILRKLVGIALVPTSWHKRESVQGKVVLKFD